MRARRADRERGEVGFDLIAAHYRRDAGATVYTARAEFVIRLKEAGSNSPTFEAVAERPLDAGASLRDVQDAAGHADPRTTRRYDRARFALDRSASYTLATFLAT